MTEKIRPCSLCTIRPRNQLSVSYPDLCWDCLGYQDWERVHVGNMHEATDCPHGCGPLQFVLDEIYVCPECEDEWTYEPVPGCPVCAGTPPPWIVASTPQRERADTTRTTSGTRGTHSSCDHDATPSARRQCRRQRSRSTT